MANEVFGYRKLIAYQKGKEVVKRTYQLLKKFPAEERYAMCDQLRRASVSISSNIAEELIVSLSKIKPTLLRWPTAHLWRCRLNLK